MRRGSSQKRAVPRTLDDWSSFFETHDMGDYWDQLPEAQFEIDLKKRAHLIAIDEEIAARISAIAKSKHPRHLSLTPD